MSFDTNRRSTAQSNGQSHFWFGFWGQRDEKSTAKEYEIQSMNTELSLHHFITISLRIWRILYLYLQKYQGQCLWSVCIPRHPNKLYNIIVPIITIIVLIIISWSVCNIQTSNYTWYLTWTLSESSTSSSDLFVSLDIQLYLTYDIAQSHWCPIRVSSMALLVMLNMIRIQKHNQLENRKRYS